MMQFFLLLSFVVACVNGAAVMKLTALNIEGAPTLSGLSSGGFMAVQMHIAHSATFNASSVYAGGPYYCAQGEGSTFAEEICMYDLMGGPKTATLISYTNDQAAKKTIDPVSNLADDKVFIFSGTKDTVVNPKVVQTLVDYYGAFIPAASIQTNFNLQAEHCIPTLNYGETCSRLQSPYIGDCAYDGAGTGLEQMLGTLNKRGVANAANLHAFDQTDFFTGSGKDISLANQGYIYIPAACAAGSSTACKLHVSFHGCSQDEASIGNDYAAHSGFNDWAETNNIVVVYPYALANMALGNPNACWDWWGYTDSKTDVNYVLQSGVQIKFAKSIVDTVMGVTH
jgi:poly(3-hydroxybutyrate) depolymerase